MTDPKHDSSVGKSELIALGGACATLGVAAACLAGVWLWGWQSGFTNSLNAEHRMETKYRGVLEALVAEAQWAHQSCVDLKQSCTDLKGWVDASKPSASSSVSSGSGATSQPPAKPVSPPTPPSTKTPS